MSLFTLCDAKLNVFLTAGYIVYYCICTAFRCFIPPKNHLFGDSEATIYRYVVYVSLLVMSHSNLHLLSKECEPSTMWGQEILQNGCTVNAIFK